MSKYNLTELLNELSQSELAKLALMQKLKTGEMDSDEFASVGDSDDAAIAKMAQMMMAKEKSMKEMRNVDYERLDGMINQSKLNKLLNTIVSIKLELEDDGEMFGNDDLVDFVSTLMEKRLDQVDATPSQDEMDPDERERQSIDMDDVREHFNRFK